MGSIGMEAVLEISSPNISGGDFLDFTDSHVGGVCLSGCYTGEISGDASSPIAGRMAWSGDSGGYIDTVINLGPNLNGQTITVRFRFGSDEAVAAPGWHIDNLSITGRVLSVGRSAPIFQPQLEHSNDQENVGPNRTWLAVSHPHLRRDGQSICLALIAFDVATVLPAMPKQREGRWAVRVYAWQHRQRLSCTAV